MLRTIAILFAIAVAIVGAIEGIGFWSCKQLPEQHAEDAKAEEAYEKYCSNIGAEFKFGSAEVVEFIHTFHDDINALSTVVIAIFTALLGVFTISVARSTRIAADAADTSSKAAIAIELPIIRAHAQKLSYGTNQSGSKQWNCVSIGELYLSNLGRTKTFPVEIQFGCTIGSRLPKKPAYRFTKPFPVNTIWEPEHGAEVTLHEFDFEAPPDLYNLLRNHAVNLWFYCNLVYLDFMQTRHEAGFCWKQHETVGMGTLFEDATSAYNRKT